jgi:hypothetical protein
LAKRLLGTAVPIVVSFFKRFTVKFVEVVGAGIATAVTGYLLAHFGGYWTSPARTPAAVQIAPNATVVSKSQRGQPAQAPSAETSEPRPASAQGAGPAATQPPRTTAKAAPVATARKQSTADTSAAESKPHDVERDMQSVEAEVRAALANVDANRPAPPEVTPRQADVPPAPPVVAVPPQAAGNPIGASAVAAAPHSDEVAPPPPPQQASISSDPLPAVEIKSRPVAAVEPSAPPASAPAAQEEDKGLLSAIKKIPDLFRPSAPASDGQAPRPPLPVGD